MNRPLAKTWSPTSWQGHAALQQPTYRDPAALAAAVEALSRLPPIVVSWEVDALKAQLALHHVQLRIMRPENQELHEESAIQDLRFALARRATFKNVDGR